MQSKSVLFVRNYTLEYLEVIGHHVCILLSESLKIMITSIYTHTYIYTYESGWAGILFDLPGNEQ